MKGAQGYGKVYGASEEMLIFTELSQRAMEFDTDGLTAAWICCLGVSHPNQGDDYASALDLCHRAQSEGYSFVRKVGTRADRVVEVMAALRLCMEQPMPVHTDCTGQCTSVGNDCCAPRYLNEAATCSPSYTPVRWVQPCADPRFREGEYRCCK